MAGREITAKPQGENPCTDTCRCDEKKKSWRIGGTPWRAAEGTLLVALAVIVWCLFSLPTIFYFRQTTDKVPDVTHV